MIRSLTTLRTLGVVAPLLIFSLAGPKALIAQEAAAQESVEASVEAVEAATLNSGDTAWILASTALVLFMTIPGLALFYGGLVRTRNVLSVLMQCLALTALMSVVWIAIGYSLAFDTTGMQEGSVGLNAFIGTAGKAFLKGIDGGTLAGSIPEVLFAAFQMTFAVITPALIIGAFAERTKFSACLWFSTLWLLIVYVPICHMTWGGAGGLFADWGVMDFAGGIVVHVTAGVAALVACVVIGPRKLWPKSLEPPHNLTMTVTGTAMLWVGWFGFNAGSALGANGDAAMALLVTHLSASAATLTWMAIEWFKIGKPSVLGAATGSIAGLAAVTPASGFIGPIGGLVIGVCSGILCWYFAVILKNKLKYDDSLDVFGVHGVGGIVGTLLVAFFAHQQFGGNQGELDMIGQLVTQAKAIGLTAVYTAIATWVILKLVDAMVGLRVSEKDEITGIDYALHDETGYNMM